MKTTLRIMMWLMLPTLIGLLILGMLSMDYWFNDGKLIANQLSGHINNGFAGVAFTFLAVAVFVMGLFFFLVLQEFNVIQKNQKEIDALRQAYRTRAAEQQEVIDHYNELILTKTK